MEAGGERLQAESRNHNCVYARGEVETVGGAWHLPCYDHVGRERVGHMNEFK